MIGTGTLSAASAQSDSSGYATVNLSLAQLESAVQVSACVAPVTPCQSFYIGAVPAAQQNLQPVAGAGQVSASQPFQAIMVRVTDSSSTPNPVIAANVMFQTTILRGGNSSPAGGNPSIPVILSVTQASAATDMNGLASLVPSAQGFSPPLEVDVAISAGISASLDDPLELLPPL